MGNERRRWKEESAKRRDKGEEETFFLGNTHEPSGQAISKAVSLFRPRVVASMHGGGL